MRFARRVQGQDVSETTSLLSQRKEAIEEELGEVNTRRGSCPRHTKDMVPLLSLGFVFVVSLSLLVFLSFERNEASDRTSSQPGSDIFVSDRLGSEELASMWEKWKVNLGESTAASLRGQNVLKDVDSVADASWHWLTDEGRAAAKGVKRSEQSISRPVQTSDWLNQSEAWTGHVWNATAADAHRVWSQFNKKAGNTRNKVSVWWNKSVASEADWKNNALHNLHKFGGHLKSWWNLTETKGVAQEERLRQAFRRWWVSATASEREWWDHTVSAARRFANATGKEAHEWWNMARASVDKDVQKVEESEKKWWDASKLWFHNHHRDTSGNEYYNKELVYLNTSLAFSWLTSDFSGYDLSADFFHYQSGFDAQITQSYCSIASSAALLNSFRNVVDDASLPVDPIYSPYHYVTQDSLLRDNNDCIYNTVVRFNDTFDGVSLAPGGLTLKQTKALLECYVSRKQWRVTVTQVDPKADNAVDDVRTALIDVLKQPYSRVIINFDRRTLRQEGGGHFSPLGAYSADYDAFLVMDVAKYKYPPVWVPTELLVASMGTIDVCADWDYPASQDKIDWSSTQDFTSQRWYHKTMKQLNCRASSRGFLTVEAILG